MDIELMCRDAQTRVTSHINRSAGQHTRAMRNQQTAEEQRIVSDLLYGFAMEMTDKGVKNVDAKIKAFCEISGVPFPPVNQGA